MEVEWKNDADAEQGDNTDKDEQILLEPGRQIIFLTKILKKDGR